MESTLREYRPKLAWTLYANEHEELQKFMPRYCGATFGLIDYNGKEEDLEEFMTGIKFVSSESSYLAGIAAGKLTKTNKIGFVGGENLEVIREFKNGFFAGVLSVNPECELYFDYVNSFGNSTKGYELATNQYNEGVDIIFQAAGQSGYGVIKAAEDSDRYAIGVDTDQSYRSPDHVITSVIKNVRSAVTEVTEYFLEGRTIRRSEERRVGKEC